MNNPEYSLWNHNPSGRTLQEELNESGLNINDNNVPKNMQVL